MPEGKEAAPHFAMSEGTEPATQYRVRDEQNIDVNDVFSLRRYAAAWRRGRKRVLLLALSTQNIQQTLTEFMFHVQEFSRFVATGTVWPGAGPKTQGRGLHLAASQF